MFWAITEDPCVKMIPVVSPLAGLASLGELYLDNNHISNVGPLGSLISLWKLDLSGNEIIDIGSLLGNAGLGSGDRIGLLGNALSAQACIDIGILEGRGVTVESACGGGAFVFTEVPHTGRYREGEALTLRVAFAGTVGVPEIQWSKNGVDIPGEISDALSIASLTVDDTAAYRVRVTDEAKAVYVTPPAIITVTEESALPLSTLLARFFTSLGIAIAGALVLRRAKGGDPFTGFHRAKLDRVVGADHGGLISPLQFRARPLRV